MKKCKIISINEIGISRTCNVTMKSDQHNYAIVGYNGSRIYTKNSHSCAYAYESFLCAYLKTHYYMEFMASKMSVEAQRRKFEYVDKCEDECRRQFGCKILPPDINRSKMNYTIIDEKTFLRPLIIKGVGDKAVAEIIKHQPFKGPDTFYSFASAVGSDVNSKAVESLIDDGLFGKVKKSKLLRNFEEIKADKKRGLGHQKGDLFG